jgi:hypothetical protein
MQKIKFGTFILLACLCFACKKNREDDSVRLLYSDGSAEAMVLGNKISFKMDAGLWKHQTLLLALAYYENGIQRLELAMDNLPQSTDTIFFNRATTTLEPSTFLNSVKEDLVLDFYDRIDNPNQKSFVLIKRLDTVKQELEGVFQICYGYKVGIVKEDVFPDTLIFTEGRFSTKYRNY